MSCLIVLPGDATFRREAVPDEPVELDVLSELVGGCIERIDVSLRWDLVVNEEGRLRGMPPNRDANALAASYGHPVRDFVGPAVLAGVRGADWVPLSGVLCDHLTSRIRNVVGCAEQDPSL